METKAEATGNWLVKNVENVRGIGLDSPYGEVVVYLKEEDLDFPSSVNNIPITTKIIGILRAE